jgi:hypothetical protein
MEPGALQVTGGHEPLGRRLAGQAIGRVGLRRDAPSGVRTLAVALQRVDARDAPLGIGQGPARAGGAARRDDLALRPRRLAEIPGELRVHRVALDDRQAFESAFALRPDVERLPTQPRRIPVGVNRGPGRDRVEQRLQRSRHVARGEPVRRHLCRVGAASAQRLGQAAVKRAAAQPWNVLVDRLANQRMAKHGSSRLTLADQAGRQQLGEPVLPADRRDQLEVERRAESGCGLGHAPCRLGQRRRLHQHGIADRLRERHVAVERELGALGALGETGAGPECRGHLLDEERHAAGARVQRGHQPRRRLPPQHLLDETGGVLGGERVERQLDQRALATQIVAQPAQRVGPRQLVGAVARHDEQGQLGEARRQCAQELQRRLVRPLQVVEQHRRRAARDHRRQAAADGFEQGRAVVRGPRVAQLGQEQRQVGAQRPA